MSFILGDLAEVQLTGAETRCCPPSTLETAGEWWSNIQRQEARVPVVVSDIASGGDTNYSPEMRLEDKNPHSYSEIRSKLEGSKYSGQKAIPRLESINGSTHGAGSARSSTGT
ncbi:hypothetical protein OPV22_035078 [Ensete ventricosum]|uniref:Uncharacterized protein n=1 Tax=Ensete ventricosum TaxID=4639 RepID=A0AAX5NIM1_ENSVE|nr:hypothetical protein OPV22_035078 [Ensete ventricosum]